MTRPRRLCALRWDNSAGTWRCENCGATVDAADFVSPVVRPGKARRCPAPQGEQ